MAIKKVIKTKSGIFIRHDKGNGIFTYSPYSGNFFALPESYKNSVVNWLDQKKNTIDDLLIKRALGFGWSIRNTEIEFPYIHLLPSEKSWSHIYLDRPLVINWLITGKCPLNCIYCYAADLMRNNTDIRDINRIKKVAASIINLSPLAVVLTGGEPLISPYLEEIVCLLKNRAGLIVDTSGKGLTEKHIKLFKDNNAFIRISLDSERPKTNDYLRPLCTSDESAKENGSAKYAFEAILKCLDAGLKVGIQSVATTRNRSDFEVLGDKLFKLGISSWRILLMTPTSSNLHNFNSLLGHVRGKKRFENQIIERILKKYKKDWKQGMSVQVVTNANPNSTILVGPDGNFYTESNIPFVGKTIIDELRPKEPSLNKIFQNVDMHSHINRYLNINYNTGGI